ncbi:hypothetical protein OG689_10895 [Kitasatospora sp. NBC_00240]|uniref:hypothetical protein n=1 Tax=Kitasatospora sp. NBC_00240 TaxID=2903567 RepID=UPI002254050E|nr:hypothetical protein [Kitasatospora sp. NBC_00240]MCX5209791.1 hypothetical protein [Kitasatospora sp. NBC_00240]
MKNPFNRDRMHCEPFEIEDAARMEANRQRLIATDPDAKAILITNIEAAHQSWKVNTKFSAEQVAYSNAKHSKGEGHLYQQLFA